MSCAAERSLPPRSPRASGRFPAAQLQAAIDKLGDLDYLTRTNAARTVRRAPASQAMPALLQAVAEHADGYVRYRALVLLTGFNDPRTKDAMRESLASPNDRLRTVAYSFFEHNPDRSMVPALLAALDKEQAEFVRPALVRALAALGDDQRVRPALLRDVGRGQDFFRSVVIEALGDYKARYALDAVTAIAKLDGPLQDDAALALGKIGDKRALETLAGLQRTAPRAAQPSIAAAICLLDVNCSTHENYLVETLKFASGNAGFQDLLRAAASGLGALGVAGHAEAVEALFEIGMPSRDDATRAPVALALGAVALRNTGLLMPMLEKHPKQDQAIACLPTASTCSRRISTRSGSSRSCAGRTGGATEGSPTRVLMQTLIGKLDF